MADEPAPLPDGIQLQTLKDRAKQLLKAVQAGDAQALERVAPYFDAASAFSLQQAQLVVARRHGFASWRRLKAFIAARDQLLELAPKELPNSAGSADWQSHCSFCKKPKEEVSKLIAGSQSTICNECVELCADILKEHGASPSSADS